MENTGDFIMDLITRAGAAREAEAIHRLEEILVIHAVTLSARRIRTVMVPADRVKTFDLGKSLRDNLRDVGPDFHRSYPVSRDGSFQNASGHLPLGEIVGLLGGGEEDDWRLRVRPSTTVEGSAPVTPWLVGFLESGETAALVTKDGGNIGWVTLGDVTSMLLGVRR